MPRVAPTAIPTPARRRPGPLKRFARGLRFGVVMVFVFGILGGSGWAVASGRAAAWWNEIWVKTLAFTADIGFSVEEVVVTGRGVSDRDAIWQALDVERGDPILSFDATAAMDRIVALPWVKSATIQRQLPDVLRLRIEERQPLALWQQDGVVRLIDADGVELAQDDLGAFGPLLLVVGFGAQTEAATLIATLENAPLVADQVTAAIWVGDRRWDLRLDNGITVQLPEDNLAAAIDQIETIEAADGLLNRDIARIDMRLDDRVVVRMTPPPAAEGELEAEVIDSNAGEST
ncbi:MAG: cell division protein FtsQ/DivIB [Pseudomonadota bacterium]